MANILILAPVDLRRRIERRLNNIFSGVEIRPLRRRSRDSRDPLGIGDTILRSGPDIGGVVVVLEDGPTALEAVPGPVVQGVPVGVLPVSRAADLDKWLDAMTRADHHKGSRFAVLSMWKPSYLEWGYRFVVALRQGFDPRGATVSAWFADEMGRDELCERLADGPDLVLYIGHGRERGWSGYRGLRWRHVEKHELRRPIGVLLTLTCSNLQWPTTYEPSFGIRWIRSGRTCAFVGSINGLRLRPLVLLSRTATELLAAGGVKNLGGLLVGLHRMVQAAADTELVETWSSFRVLGNPLQRF